MYETGEFMYKLYKVKTRFALPRPPGDELPGYSLAFHGSCGENTALEPCGYNLAGPNIPPS